MTGCTAGKRAERDDKNWECVTVVTWNFAQLDQSSVYFWGITFHFLLLRRRRN